MYVQYGQVGVYRDQVSFISGGYPVVYDLTSCTWRGSSRMRAFWPVG